MKPTWRRHWTMCGAGIGMLAGLFCGIRSPAESTNSIPTTARAPAISGTNAFVKPAASTNQIGYATNPVTNDVTRVLSFPAPKMPAGRTSDLEAPGIFNKGVGGGVEARLDRFERMNGRKLLDFDGPPTRRRIGWLKSPTISPQYRWDTFQNGKPPPKGFRDGITSTYFD